jgi:Signal transduction histidine kinase regulating citrate/malate metabolism
MSILSKMIDKRIAVYQNSLIKTHYDEVENMYNQIRGWRHDYRNHIQVMKTHAANGELDSIIKYLDELETDLTTIDTVIKTGNKMTDAILNSKISLARSKNVPVDITADISVALTISELDLCVIIGNLFDNAIEANLALPEDKRRLNIYMEMKGTQLYMSFTNMTASKKQRKESGKYRSSKVGDGHGFGLVRIDNIISRYGGYINRNSEDGAFTTEVLLPQ